MPHTFTYWTPPHKAILQLLFLWGLKCHILLLQHFSFYFSSVRIIFLSKINDGYLSIQSFVLFQCRISIFGTTLLSMKWNWRIFFVLTAKKSWWMKNLSVMCHAGQSNFSMCKHSYIDNRIERSAQTQQQNRKNWSEIN